LNIELLAVGTKPPAWVREGFRDYQARFPRDWQLELREIPTAKRNRRTSVGRLKEEEGERILGLVKQGARLVALDATGEMFSTEQLAGNLGIWMHDYNGVQLMIGGPDGLAKTCLDAAHGVWSLSKLTFPHFLVRVLVAEQLYRAWSLMNNHPYHR